MRWRRAVDSLLAIVVLRHNASVEALTSRRCVLSKVSCAVSSQKSGAFVGWGWSSWELLVKAHNLLHADGI